MSRVFRTQKRPRAAAPAVSGSTAFPDPEAAAAALREEARSILAQAREEAAALVDQAQAEANMVTTEAREAGRSAGYADGLAKGLGDAEDLIKEAAQALESARSAHAAMLKDTEPKILALVMEVSRRVLRESLATDPRMVLELIRKGLDSLRDEREFSFRVDPALVSLIEGEKEALGREYGAKLIEVVGDPEVSSGAVIVTPHGYVDVTIGAQIRNITAALAEAKKKAMGMELQ